MLSGIFSGRIGRLAFFLGYIYLHIPIVVLVIVYALINSLVGDIESDVLRGITNVVLFGFGAIWTVLYFVISIDLSVRRWHDIDQTGWLVFLYFVPIASFVAMVVQLVVPGNPEDNRYGTPVSGLGIKQVLFHKYPTPTPPTTPTDPPVAPIA